MTEYTSPRSISVASTAKLVRAELKKEFSGTIFSVRSKSYSGGASIRVEWTDGPTSKAVDQIVWKYRGASFDGMIDLKSYHNSELNGEVVHYGADYINCTRTLSIEFLTAVASAYCARYNEVMPKIVVSGSAYIEDRQIWDHSHYTEQIMEKAYETDAGKLDQLFSEEDLREAEYQAYKAERDAQGGSL